MSTPYILGLSKKSIVPGTPKIHKLVLLLEAFGHDMADCWVPRRHPDPPLGLSAYLLAWSAHRP